MEKYQKLTQLQHLLKRPGMYIGEIYNVTQPMYIMNGSHMECKEITYNPGIVKCLDEIILNACDHAIETNEVTKIKVTLDQTCISVLNNGPGIPIVVHEDEGIYIPELVFSHFLTSSNYNDDEKRLKSGLNGLGAKITSAFSKKFRVETVWENQCYVQEFTDNLHEIHPPKIKKVNKQDYTKITFYPDFDKFKVSAITNETYKVLERRVYDIAAYTNNKVKVYLNDKKLEIASFKDYVSLFLTDDQKREVVIQCNDRWKVAVCSSKDELFTGISFVNGVHTHDHGTHVNHVLNQAIRHITKRMNSSIRAAVLKEQLMILLFAQIENPEFKSQAKDQLTTKSTLFGSSFAFDGKSMKQLSKLTCIPRIQNYIQYKLNKELSKSDGKKTKKITGIPNLDDANKAGGKESQKCTLFITEGLSAKTFAIAGLSIIGRDYYGVFPLKGKLLNVRAANMKQIIQNNEIQHIKKILGLSTTSDNTIDNLRYGKVCLLCDADTDGQHIQGLLINFFHYFWPELVQNQFITSLRTPVIKATKGNQVFSFFDINEFKKFDAKGYKIKYYKGLGSSTSQEAKDVFRQYSQNQIKFICSESDSNIIDLAFSKQRAQDRKEWIREYTGKELVLKVNQGKVNMDQFFNSSFVQYSIADCARSIPNIMDGLKPTQRKILYGFLKKGTLNELKVDQIRGYIAEQTLYAHGETSLNETIISMNHNFVGSNNINLFIPCGAFGSRLMGGKDAASPRYISTKLNPMTMSIFNAHDEPLLQYNCEGDIQIEPVYYVPIIPMILVNGCSGIGTGFSTDIPCYNPMDIIDAIESSITTGEHKSLTPWYKSFKGRVNGTSTEGIIERSTSTTLKITELPIGVWTDKYKEFLELLVEKGVISKFVNYSTETEVSFVVHCPKLHIQEWVSKDQLLDVFKLVQPLKINLTCFDEKGVLCVYNSVDEILSYFIEKRISFYKKRYKYLLEQIQKNVHILSEKVRFLQLVISDKLHVFRNSKQQVIDQLKRYKFEHYDIYLDIKIHQFTNDYVEKYQNELTKEQERLEQLQKQKPIDLWIHDLRNLRELLNGYYL